MLKGLTTAFKQTMGIGGYPKIIYINGYHPDPEKRLLQISDYRSKLAAEIVAAANDQLLDEERAVELVDGLIFEDRPFAEVNRQFLTGAKNRRKLLRFLRGYKSGTPTPPNPEARGRRR
jgi:hypothetical protein